MKLVSFYCDPIGDNFYSNCAKILESKCKKLSIDYVIRKENFGKDWIDNVRAKPTFLLKMIDELKEDFIWIDIDCDIQKKVDFQISSDWLVDFRSDSSPHDYVHCIRYSEKSIAFLKRWIKLIEENKKGSHSAFIEIYKSINIGKIPEGYFSLGLSPVSSKKNYFKNGKKI